MKLFSEFSVWYIPVCILIGLGLTFLLYRKDKKLSDAPNLVKRILFALRLSFISIILIIILGIFIESNKTEIEKPIIVVLQDNSESIVVNKDSLFYVNEYSQKLGNIISTLENNYDVHSYSFGNDLHKGIKTTYSEKETNISQVLQELSTTYYNRNIGAIVLATDGLYTKGSNPIYTLDNLPFATPVYSIALGDTVQAKDVLISDFQNNKIAFRENPFPVKVKIQAHSLEGKNTVVKVYESDKLIQKQNLFINSNKLFTELDFKITAKTLGKHIYTVKIDQLEGEISYENNSASFIIDVLESRQKVAIVYNHIHPDIAAIKNALKSNQNIELEVFSVDDKFNISDFNCIVFHGLPTNYGQGKVIVNKAVTNRIPVWYIYNTSTEFSLLPQNNSGLTIRKLGNGYDDVQALVNSDFNVFQINDQTTKLLQEAPPVTVPYGFYSPEAQSQTALWQSMNAVQMQRPLLLFSQKDGVKTACFTGEGLWRWRVFNNKQNGNSELFDEFINKVVGYLALREKRALFSVQSKDVFEENQDIIISAELYNKTFEAITDKTINLSVYDSAKNEYPYVFTPLEKNYTVNVGSFPAGVYNFKASVDLEGEKQVKTGTFIVSKIQNEYIQTQADHSILRTIAINTNGSVFFTSNMEALSDSITANKAVTAISHTISQRNNLVDYLWLFILLIFLISTEWFLRKFYSSY